VLTPEGTLVIVGGEEGGRWFGGLQRQLLVMLLSPFVRQKLCTYVSMGRQEELQFLRGLLEEGKLTPAIDRSFPLSEAPDAIRYFEAGHAKGKVVISL
jgi:NADPH:quinone reductase-like Zn-dependent oxidoreductase